MAFEPVDCRIDAGLDSLLGKWKIPVLIQLRATPVLRFSDLQRALPDVTKKMLTQTLRELAADDLVQRTVYPTVPPKVEYRLTAHGQELIPTLDALHAWGIQHRAHLQALGQQGTEAK
ncbi:winged helix-turn-helix transcriptional regulator [Limosilactobacillus ingluviei]|uniref:winged helix-turn-helix transcriptional regulator n=1 Tax=Limosilactobacillus ingluviei TaxID=148604 RepID=UPI001959DCB1|nr:helix-turn-helix domain-containing protein [Limosilactobacillus ingluviei]MBM6729460.1 helix-turn-helix transcriptional regulator [Limosilactobacillus ingluviei]